MKYELLFRVLIELFIHFGSDLEGIYAHRNNHAATGLGQRMEYISAEGVQETLKQLKRQAEAARKHGISASDDLVWQHNRAEDLYRRGAYAEAETLEMERLLVLLAQYGPEDERVIESMEAVGAMHFGAKKDSPYNLLDAVIWLRIKTQGESHGDTLASFASKVGQLTTLGKLAEAEELGQYLVRVCKESLGSADDATLRAMSNLASIYTQQGRLEEAEPLALEVLQIREEKLPRDDPDTVRSMVNLSGIYFGQKRWKDAALLLQTALTIRRKLYGEEHPMTMNIARQLEHAYTQLRGARTDLLTVQLYIAEAARKTYGEDHLRTIHADLALISTYVQRSMWKDAIEATESVLDRQKKRLPDDDPEVVQLQSYLDVLLQNFPNRETKVTAASSLIYSSLDPTRRQIRLVRLFKGNAGDPLSVALVQASLDALTTFPPYEALSYVWGSTGPAKQLILDGHTIDIGPNLDAALSRLRYPTHDRILWVDAICINQEDPKERSEQVRLMRDIYSLATRTLVWLGEDLGESREAMEFMATLESQATPVHRMAKVLKVPGNERAKNIVNGLWELALKRPYWTRLWIIQELVCGKNIIVYHGPLTVPLAVIRDMSDVLMEAINKLDKGHPDVPHHLRLAHEISSNSLLQPLRDQVDSVFHHPQDFLSLLRLHRVAECSNPKDRIYALLGISDLANSTHPGLEIDYSLSTSAIYRRAARAIIEETSRLDILSAVTDAGRHPTTGEYRVRQPFLPSWVPDWNLHKSTSLSISSITGSWPAQAAGEMLAKVQFVHDDTMVVEGVVVAEVSDFGTPFEIEKRAHRDIIRIILAWREKVLMYAAQQRIDVGSESQTSQGSAEKNEAKTEPRKPRFWERALHLDDLKKKWREKAPQPLSTPQPGQSKTSTPLDTARVAGAGESLMDKFSRLLEAKPPTEDMSETIFNERTWARWWMVLHNRPQDDTGPGGSRPLQGDPSTGRKWWITVEHEDGSSGPVVLSELEKWQLTATYHLCAGRRLCFFKDPRPGHAGKMNMGLCPKETVKGDVVVVVLGCSVPIVLRPVDDHFVVVGEAFVPDFMRGEALEGTPVLESFKLR